MRTFVGGLLLATLSVFSVSAQAAATAGQDAASAVAAAAAGKNCNEVGFTDFQWGFLTILRDFLNKLGSWDDKYSSEIILVHELWLLAA